MVGAMATIIMGYSVQHIIAAVVNFIIVAVQLHITASIIMKNTKNVKEDKELLVKAGPEETRVVEASTSLPKEFA
ncbi:hypothetical protein Hamer_G016869 [Homarus americanus]|uniref:Uncharacterized protein n=2 Tax=Homarus americanus TaxID=6706 RepID=A0A8J5K160_HOMAM|nr:hypothetical protein Hamer_G016869 [Homarus americanus]